MRSRNILIYLSMKYKGDWDLMMDEFKNKRTHFSEEDIRQIDELDVDAITILDEDYPSVLKNIEKPPFVLFYKGNRTLINDANYHYLAVVGSRNSTLYGEAMTLKIIKDLPKDTCIVSGLAKGIDRKAHEEALKNNLKTIAVLGNGIDIEYPKCNKELYKKIPANNGLILSEYPNGVVGTQNSFLVRNRIIAGLSKCTLLIESYDRSGAVNTVNYAIYFGKNVGCVPSSALRESNPNKFIKDGAALIENAKDLEGLF